MVYSKRNWPSGTTPISKDNLEAMDEGIYQNSKEIENLKNAMSANNLRKTIGVYPPKRLTSDPTTAQGADIAGESGQFGYMFEYNNVTLKHVAKLYICRGFSDDSYIWNAVGGFSSDNEILQVDIENAVNKYFKENPFEGTGTDGKSAYQIALDNGFDGTEEEWLNSLKGADGENGISPIVTLTPYDGGVNLYVQNGDDGGSKLVSIKDGADGYTPVKGTDYWTAADKQEIINELTVSTSNVPTYWQAPLDIRVDNIREVMEKAGRNKSAFLFYSDAHWDSGSKYAPMLLNYLTANTAINKTIYGGDIVSTEPTTDTISDRTIMKYLWDWRTQIRNLRHYSVVGNHDDGNATNNIFSSDYVYSFLFAPEENNNIVRGADTYYYFDDSREQTRYLCLDTAYEGLSALSTAQTTFIKEALKSTPENWHIIVVAHVWYMPDYNQYGVRPIPLTGLSDTATQIVTILDNYNARVDEFADCKAKIEFCIGGHVHRDYVDKTTGGIPIILCETASLNIRGEFTYTLGTITETSVSGIVADYDNDKVSVIRVGRGNSFEVELSTGTVTEIEDADEGTTEPTYTNVLDTVGYTEGIRLSGSDGGERTNDGSDTTGFIPCSGGDIIYLKNVQMVDSSTGTDYSGYISHFKEDESFINGYYYNTSVLGDEYSNYVLEVDENGYYTKLKVPAITDLALIRITCLGIDETSIITVNEPIE